LDGAAAATLRGLPRDDASVPLPSLTLALRALWFRRGVSLAVLLVAVVTVAAAAAGPLYLRAGGESVLRDALTAPSPDVTGLDAILMGGAPLEQLRKAVAAAGVPHGYPRQILSLQARSYAPGTPGFNNGQTRLMWRDGACGHLHVVVGHCPTGAHDVLISQRTQRATGRQLGQVFTLCPLDRIGKPVCRPASSGQRPLVVRGIYALPESDRFWFNQPYFNAQPALGDGPDSLDTSFVARAGLGVVVVGGQVQADVQLPLDPTLVRQDGEGRLRAELARFRSALARQGGPPELLTGLPHVLDRADRDRADLSRSVLVVTLQLVALAFVVLRLVVADASEARAGEVALAKLRGYRAGPTLALGVLEPLLLLLLAVPVGLLVAAAAVHLLSATVLVPGTPVVVRPPSVLSAAAAFAGGVLAALLAGRRVLTRSVLEQWRRTGEVGPARATAAIEVVAGALAALGLVVLVARGGLHAGGRGSALTLFVPLLMVVVVALLGVPLLPAACRALVRRTRGSRRLGAFLAVRTVARRPAGLRLAALLAVAVGLATFAVDGSLVSGGNRGERAATDVGAPTVLVVRTGGTADLRRVVRHVDPQGRWAMAAERWLPFGGLRGTVLAVDSAALPRVAHWRADFADQSLGQVAAGIGRSAPPPVRITGREIGLDVTTVQPPRVPSELHVFLTRAGAQVDLPLGPVRTGAHRYAARISGCSGGCALAGVVVGAAAPSSERDLSGHLRLTGVVERSGAAWRVVPLDLAVAGGWHQQQAIGVTSSNVGAQVSAVDWQFTVGGGDSAVLLRSALAWPLHVAPGQDVFEHPEQPSVSNFTGPPVPVTAEPALRVVPQQGREATLVDLDAARLALPRFEEFAEQQVWLSDGAPVDAAERLRAAGLQVVEVRTTAARRSLLDRTAPALGLDLFAYAGVLAALLAAAATAVALYLSGRRRAFEMAAMLAVGVPRRSLLAAAATEQLLVLGTALVLGVVGGLGAATLVLPAVPELPDPGPPDLRYAPHVGGLVLFLAGLAVVVLLSAVSAALGLLRQARPGVLREAAP